MKRTLGQVVAACGPEILRRGSCAREIVLVVRSDLRARVEPMQRVQAAAIAAGALELASGLAQPVIAPHEVLVLHGKRVAGEYVVTLDVYDVDGAAR